MKPKKTKAPIDNIKQIVSYAPILFSKRPIRPMKAKKPMYSIAQVIIYIKTLLTHLYYTTVHSLQAVYTQPI